MTNKPTVSIVVLSWNTNKETETCLGSLHKLTYKNREIVVVDNGSTDGSKEYLAKQKDIVYVDLPENTGFTGGQIEALKHAKGEYIALINSDAVVAPDWIEQALSCFKDNSKVAAVGGRAYLWNEQYRAYNTTNPFYSYQVIDPNKGYAETIMAGDEIVEVNSISGAGVMVSRKAIDKVGYFDDRFFAYYEETDLFARMKRAGYKIMYNPGIHTWHKIGQSTKDKPFFYLYQMHRNRFLFAYKNFDTTNLKEFTSNYKKEFLASLKRASTSKRSIDDKARIEAYYWNKVHINKTKKDRLKVQKLGATYTKSLLKDASQNVSIVIPCYNYGEYVQQAIRSALNQSQKPLEVIVINDGSKDNSKKKILELKDKIIFIDKKNEGVIATKNLGLEKAKGSWIIFLDADDYLDEKYIEKCLKLARSTSSDIVYTNMQLFGAKKEQFVANEHTKRQIRRGNYIHNSALLKTDLVRQAGGYKSEMKGGFEDWELYLSMIEAGAIPKWLDESLLYYRQHAVNSRNILAQEKGEVLLKKAIDLHPKLFGLNYRFENTATSIVAWSKPKKKYAKILWPPMWVKITKANTLRIKVLKKDEEKKKTLKKKISKATKTAKKVKVRSTLLEIKKAKKYYQSLDKSTKKKEKHGKNTH